MANFYIAQAGTALEAVQTDGTRVALTLPTGIAIVSTVFPRFAILGKNLLMVNSPTRSLWIDSNRTVRPMSIAPPQTAPILAASSGSGALSGVFRVRVTFGVKDVDTGEILLETAFGPISAASAAIASKKLNADGIPISPDTDVNFRRLYRTTDGGSVFFQWIDIDDNTQTQIEDDLADLSLDDVAAPTDLGSAPGTTAPTRLVLVASWRDRLWGVGSEDPDTLLYSSDGKFYAWPPANGFIIPPKGRDNRGVTAFLPRQDELGVGRYDSMHMMTGSTTPFTRVQLAEGIGVVNQEVVQVIKDKAYFLGNPYGVYRWDANGVVNISDKAVNKWFTSDTYFNRSRFGNAFSAYDPVNHLYILFLANNGDTTENRWIYYDITADEWYGPHQTGAFTPSCGVGIWSGGALVDVNDVAFPVVGGTTGFIWKNQSTRTDDTATAIDLDIDSAFHSADTPSIQKVFEQMDILTKVQSSGTLTVTPKYGGLDAAAGTAMSHNMTLGRQRLAYGRAGRFAQYNFRNNNVGEDVVIYGYEVPNHELGRH